MEQENQKRDLIDKTDCLEASGVFRGWKNFLFVIVLLLLLAVQGSFWVTELGLVKSEDAMVKPPDSEVPPSGTDKLVVPPDENSPNEVNVSEQDTVPANTVTSQVEQAARWVVESDANMAKAGERKAEKEEKSRLPALPFKIKQSSLEKFVKVVNFILLPAAVLYCLTILFSLKVSLVGRLGGVNHITRAFFVSLVFVILLMPWQVFFEGVFKGVMFTPSELLRSCGTDESCTAYSLIIHYLRFVVYWLIAFVLFISAQIKTMRWSRKTLQRLGVA